MAKLESKKYVIGKAKIRDFSAFVPVSFADFDDKEHLCELLERKLDNFSLEVAEMLRVLESTKQESMSELVRYIAEQETAKNSLKAINEQLLEMIDNLESSLNNTALAPAEPISQKETDSSGSEISSEADLMPENEAEPDFVQEQSSELPEDNNPEPVNNSSEPSDEESVSHDDLSSDSDVDESLINQESKVDSESNEEVEESSEVDPLADELPDNPEAAGLEENTESSIEQEASEEGFSGLSPFSEEDENEDKDKINFNQLITDTQFPRQKTTRQRMEENMSDDALEMQRAMEKINIMRNRLHPVNDEHGFLPTEKSEKIDAILTKELDELEASHNLDLEAAVTSDMEDAALVEAMNLAEKLDKENYPDLYDVDKDSLLYYIQAQISARNLRRKRSLVGEENREHRRPVNTLSHYGRAIIKNNPETNPDLPRRAEPKLESQTVPQGSEPKDAEDSKDLDLPATTSNENKNEKSEITDELNKALNALNGEAEEKAETVPSTPEILTAEIKTDNKPNPISSLFNGNEENVPQADNDSSDEPALDEDADIEDTTENAASSSENKLLPVEVPVEFLTKLEKIKSRIFKYRVYMTLSEIRDFENNDNAVRMQELVEEARARHWKNK